MLKVASFRTGRRFGHTHFFNKNFFQANLTLYIFTNYTNFFLKENEPELSFNQITKLVSISERIDKTKSAY